MIYFQYINNLKKSHLDVIASSCFLLYIENHAELIRKMEFIMSID